MVRHLGAVWHDWLQRDMLRSAGKHTGGPSLLLIRAQRSDVSPQGKGGSGGDWRGRREWSMQRRLESRAQLAMWLSW